MKRFILTVLQKSAEGKVGQAVSEASKELESSPVRDCPLCESVGHAAGLCPMKLKFFPLCPVRRPGPPLVRHSKAERRSQQIGQAGNRDRRPERKGVASKSRDLRNDPRPKSQ